MKAQRILPGELSREEETARMIRVNQAGEYGAARIYAGQLAVLKSGAAKEAVAHMAVQEQRHLDSFNRLLAKRRVRPTLLAPLWHVAGFALGAATALLGKEAAMACTVAVESVIDEHYASQEKRLADYDPELSDMVSDFRREEMEHHAVALKQGAEQAPFYPLLSAAIRGTSRMAIWLSTRL